MPQSDEGRQQGTVRRWVREWSRKEDVAGGSMRLLCFAVFCSFLALYWSVFAVVLCCFVLYLY